MRKTAHEKIRISFHIPVALLQKIDERAEIGFLERTSWIIKTLKEAIDKEEAKIEA